MGSIKNVISEAIEGHEEYHILVCEKPSVIPHLLVVFSSFFFARRNSLESDVFLMSFSSGYPAGSN